FPSLVVSMDWEPYQLTAQRNVFISRFPGEGRVLWTMANRNEYAVDGEQFTVEHVDGTRYYDVWHGRALEPRVIEGQAVISLALEGRGFGAVLALAPGVDEPGLDAFLATIAAQADKPLNAHSAAWRPLPQTIVEVAPTAPRASAPEGMVTIPAGEFLFKVDGTEIEGFNWAGVDVQYPWEESPRRHHHRRMDLPSFHIDRHPVTNAQFQRFLADSGYQPRDAVNFLRHWVDGAPRPGWEHKPVTWVSLEDARAYAGWAGKRL